jgi:hypothetical protein
MTTGKRTFLKWLGAIALVLLVFALWVMRGNPSDLDPMKTTGKDPLSPVSAWSSRLAGRPMRRQSQRKASP